MEDHRSSNEAAVRHLHKAIERMRRDLAEIQFWADAVSGFSQPVPDYDPAEMMVWLPPEQASMLKRHKGS